MSVLPAILAALLWHPAADSSPRPDPSASPRARRGGTLRFSGSQPPKSFNAYVDNNSYTAMLFSLMYETLLDSDPETGEPKVDNQGNIIYEQYQIFFTAEEMLERHNNACLDENGVDTKPFVIDAGNQAFCGWLTFDVVAGESYYVFQLSSQLGFGGYEFNFADGISELSTVATTAPAVRYNLAGQRVDSQYKGVVVENGKKYIVK